MTITIGDKCPKCHDGTIQDIEIFPQPGDEVVCSNLGCDWIATIQVIKNPEIGEYIVITN